jgi:hypothetical protein
MAAAPINLPNKGLQYSNIVKPIDINLQFQVLSTAGAGTTSVKSNGYVKSVYMHSSSPSSTNPNPAVGYAQIQLNGNYNVYVDSFQIMQSPVTGSAINISGTSVMTVGKPYIITSLGTSTQANFAAVGLPAGIVPAVGQSFIASVTGGGTGTGQVKAVGISGITAVEVIGNPTLELSNPNQAANGGGIILLQFLAPTNSTTTTLIPTAPTDTSVICMTLRMDGSSVTVDGL